MNKDKLRLEDILKAIEFIFQFVRDKEYNEFESDMLLKSAVMAQLLIIGEAGKNVSQDLQSNNHQIEWSKLSAMRNILVHEYFGVEWEIVWDTIKEDLPKLKEKIEKVLQDL